MEMNYKKSVSSIAFPDHSNFQLLQIQQTSSSCGNLCMLLYPRQD